MRKQIVLSDSLENISESFSISLRSTNAARDISNPAFNARAGK